MNPNAKLSDLDDINKIFKFQSISPLFWHSKYSHIGTQMKRFLIEFGGTQQKILKVNKVTRMRLFC